MPENILVPSVVDGSLPVDVREDDLLALSPQVLSTLLRDHTTGHNIFWATHDYEVLGEGYGFFCPVAPETITGENGMVIRPRVLKSREQQTDRSKDMAEVFTPSWICNAQNNLVDEAWFGRKDVFNVTSEDGKTWKSTTAKVSFPEDKTWKDYVRATRLEITCGEAPYLVSRYDTTTGNPIPIQERIGLLDRKLRVVSENTQTSGEWLEWAQVAFQNTYGYEWQGDSLLLARENLLLSFIEYYREKFGKMPMEKSINYIAYVVSWNLWQMDGLKMVVPCSCKDGVKVMEQSLFGKEERMLYCQGCQQDKIKLHNGTYCIVRDWRKPRDKQKIPFVSLLK